MTLADEHDVDVLIYHRDGTVYVDSRTGAPEHLLGLLDGLGLDRHCMPEENDAWHQVLERWGEIAMKEMADRAVPLRTGSGYRIAIDTVFGGTAGQARRRSTAVAAPIRCGATCRRTPPLAPLPVTVHRPAPAPGGRPRYPREIPIPAHDRTPPPITTSRNPRLAAALFRRYLRAVAVGSRERSIPVAGARPEAVLSEAHRLGRRS